MDRALIERHDMNMAVLPRRGTVTIYTMLIVPN